MHKQVFKFLLINYSAVLLILGCSSKESISRDHLIPITVQLKDGIEATSTGYYLALNKGFYFDEGLDVKLIPGGWAINSEEPVLSGSATFGITWLSKLILLMDQDKPLVHLSQIAGKSGTRLVSYKSSGMDIPIKLINRRVTIWPKEYGTEFFLYLGINGVDPQHIMITEDTHPLNQLLEKNTDLATFLSYNEFLALEDLKLDISQFLIYDGAKESWGLPQDCIFTHESVFKESPELCQSFVRASIKGWQYVITNPKESINVLKDYDKGNKLDIHLEFNKIREFCKLIKPAGTTGSAIGQLTPVDFKKYNDLLLKYRIIHKPLDQNQFASLSPIKP